MVGPLDCGCSGSSCRLQYPAQRHRDIVVGRPRTVGPGLAEAGDRAMDQPGVGGLEDVLSQSELGHDRRAGSSPAARRRARELEQDRSSRVGAQVELDAALAAIVGDEVRAVLPAAEAAERIALRRLDLDDLGAEIGQHQARERRRDHRAQLDDAHALENVGHRQGYSAAWICTPAYSLSESGCSAGSTSSQTAGCSCP